MQARSYIGYNPNYYRMSKVPTFTDILSGLCTVYPLAALHQASTKPFRDWESSLRNISYLMQEPNKAP